MKLVQNVLLCCVMLFGGLSVGAMEESDALFEEAERRPEEFNCEACGQFFASSSELGTHLLACEDGKQIDLVLPQLLDSPRGGAGGSSNEEEMPPANDGEEEDDAAGVQEDAAALPGAGAGGLTGDIFDVDIASEPLFPCPTCGLKYKNARGLVRHQNTAMGYCGDVVIKKDKECPVCHNMFAGNVGLGLHMRMHKDKAFLAEEAAVAVAKPKMEFICQEHCGKRFKNKRTLGAHRLEVRGGKKACLHCGREFSTMSHVLQHENTHTHESTFPCDTCGAVLADKAGLARHNRIHRGDRRFICDICNQTFNQSAHYTAHKRTHTNERPFVCETCGKAFKQSGQLTSHEKSHEKSHLKKRSREASEE